MSTLQCMSDENFRTWYGLMLWLAEHASEEQFEDEDGEIEEEAYRVDIESDEPMLFEMANWVTEYECGTSACAWGWGYVHGLFEDQSPSSFESKELRPIIYPSSYYDYDPKTTLHPKDVLRRMRDFARGKGVDLSSVQPIKPELENL